jgi:hypothetical protein
MDKSRQKRKLLIKFNSKFKRKMKKKRRRSLNMKKKRRNINMKKIMLWKIKILIFKNSRKTMMNYLKKRKTSKKFHKLRQ